MNEFAQKGVDLINDLALLPLKHFFLGLNPGERSVLYALLALAAVLGFVMGRRRTGGGSGSRSFGAWRFPSFQNPGEELVSRVLRKNFGAPDYHLMNHVTLRMDDGTTQVDHILVSRFGVFVIETKNYKGWIFANATDATWTRVHFRRRHKFQNPVFQNYRHVVAVRTVLEFLPSEAIKSVVVFCGDAEFKTETPAGVLRADALAPYLKQESVAVISLNQMQLCVGRLETARLAISGKTDVEHVQRLARRFGKDAE
jgi:hypothetical protein